MSITTDDVRQVLRAIIEPRKGTIVLAVQHEHSPTAEDGSEVACGTFDGRSCSTRGVGVRDFVRMFQHATALTHAALVTENDAIRDVDGNGEPLPVVKGTRPDAKGLRAFLDEWKAKGILAP